MAGVVKSMNEEREWVKRMDGKIVSSGAVWVLQRGHLSCLTAQPPALCHFTLLPKPTPAQHAFHSHHLPSSWVKGSMCLAPALVIKYATSSTVCLWMLQYEGQLVIWSDLSVPPLLNLDLLSLYLAHLIYAWSFVYLSFTLLISVQ